MYIIYISDDCGKCLKAINLLKIHNSKYIIRKLKTFNKKQNRQDFKSYSNRIVLQKELEILMNDQWEKYLIHLGVNKHTKHIQLNELINLPIIYDLKNQKYIGSYEDLLKKIELKNNI